MIPYGKQDITQLDIDAVVKVLQSDFVTQGPTVPGFESEVAAYTDSKYGIATNSATSALHLSCLALGLSTNDILWTSPITFVASANCALYCGAKVDFVDIDPKTYNISIEKLSEKLEIAEKNNRLPKILIPVHLCGQSCDMAAIHELGEKYGFKIIEDASHAVGGKYKNLPIGNCLYSDITIFSFHPVKIITTGEGGIAMTNNELLAERMRRLRSHGITSDQDLMDFRPTKEIWNYQQIELGFNYRITDIQAALGRSQLTRLDEFVNKRHQIAERYDAEFKHHPITIPWQHPDTRSSYHLYPLRFNLDQCKKTQKEIYYNLRQMGVLVNLHYIPVYRQPYYEKFGFKEGYCPESESYYKEVLSIPMYSALSESEQDQVVSSVLEVIKK